MKQYLTQKAFTLVELIVVVTILALLWAIWFVSYVNYLVWVRDTNRIVQLTSIKDWFIKHKINKQLPLPTQMIEIRANWTLIWYQWYAWDVVLDAIEFTQNWKDPKEKVYFNYYLNSDRRHFQLMAFLEDKDNLQTGIPLFSEKANASIDYTTRYQTVMWDKMWILTQSTTNIPIQDLNVISLSGVLDIATTDYEFNAYFSDNEKITWTGSTLIRMLPNGSCKRIKDIWRSNGNWLYKISIDWVREMRAYCDMETDGWWWTLVLKADWNNTTFKYDSSYWTNSTPYNTWSYRFDYKEFKSELFSSLYFDEINLQFNTDWYIKNITLPVSANSLEELFNWWYTQTNIWRDYWKDLIPDSSLQLNCNQEWINSTWWWTNVRIWIIWNNEDDCSSPDSRIWIWTEWSNCGQDDNNSSWNEARCSADNWNQSIKSMWYIFIK